MKTIGITCDDYKLSHFEKEFEAADVEFIVHDIPFLSKLIRIYVEEEDYDRTCSKVDRICRKLELTKPWIN